jgi:PIN domain nuclease of toxin-antitoxin system
LLVSAATRWEIAIKVGLGKLTLSSPYHTRMNDASADLGLAILPVTVEYAAAQAALACYHRDPFDRLVIAQALTEGIPIVRADSGVDRYGVTRIW